MTATCRNRALLSINNETLVYIPRRLNDSVVNVTGQAVLNAVIKNPDQSRLVVINPTCEGDYSIVVANNTQLLKDARHRHSVTQHPVSNHALSSLSEGYELYRQLHRAAVEIGQTFAASSSASIDKKRVLEKVSMFETVLTTVGRLQRRGISRLS